MAGTTQIGYPANFPNGFANGLMVRGVPLLQAQPGQVFFVGNGPVLNPNQKGGSNSNRGTFLDPFSTWNYAVNTACVAGRGDIVFILPNHYETLSNATTMTVNCSSVATIGLGTGANRPTFVLDTAATANIPVRAACCSIQNLLFEHNFADITSTFTGISASVTGTIATSASLPAGLTGGYMNVTAVGSGTLYVGATIMGTAIIPGTQILSQISGTTGGVGTYQVSQSQTFASGTITTGSQDFSIDGCEFRDLSSSLNSLAVYTSSTTANASDGLSITRSNIFGLGATANTALVALAENLDRLTIQGNYHANALAATSGLIYQPTTTKVLTRVLIDQNKFVYVSANAATGVLLVTTATTHTGIVSNNYVNGLRAIASAVLVTANSGFHFYDNKYHLTADASGVILPAAQT